MYENNLFTVKFLLNLEDKNQYQDWENRVFDYSNKFEMDSDKANFIAEELYCRLINDLDTLQFPISVKDVQRLEGIGAQLPLNVPSKVFERFHLVHFVIYSTLSKKGN